MYLRAIRRTGLRPWLAVPVCIAALATLATLTANPPAARAATAPAVSAASAPAVGVQDSWINSCDSDPYRALLPGQTDPAHKHKVKIKGKTELVPYKDNAVPAVDSPNWGGLGVGTVRFSPTWDIALPASELKGKHDPAAVGIERTCFDYWLSHTSGAKVKGKPVTAEIAFKPDYCYDNKRGCPDSQQGQVVIPALGEYQAAMSAFVKAYPQVSVIAPWGEPDFQPGKKEPTFKIGSWHGANFGQANCARNAPVNDCGPKLAAAMWTTVRKLTSPRTVTVIAGDFGGGGSHDQGYLKPYNAYLRAHGAHPSVWGIHPYGDVKHEECQLAKAGPCKPEVVGNCKAGTLVACFSGWLKADGYNQRTRIWLDELSSFYKAGKKHVTKGWNRNVQAGGATYLLSKLPKVTKPGDPVVTRIYYMRFAGTTNDALIVRGHREPAYTAVANRT